MEFLTNIHSVKDTMVVSKEKLASLSKECHICSSSEKELLLGFNIIQYPNILEAIKKYKGRKPSPIDTLKFLDMESEIRKGKKTVKEASKELGISIDRYYRYRKKTEEKILR